MQDDKTKKLKIHGSRVSRTMTRPANPPMQPKFKKGKYAFDATISDNQQARHNLRAQQAQPSRRKPSMPKMPWDK